MNVDHSQTGNPVTAKPPHFFSYGGNDSLQLAWRADVPSQAGQQIPGIVWLGGFKSDMLSTKAERISQWAKANDRAFLRFDYSGHGESGGAFEEGTISQWMDQSLTLIRALTKGPQILVGSSMGGWITLLVARALATLKESHRLAGLVLIAPAVDFTEELIWARLPESARNEILSTGYWLRPTQYAPDPYAITRALIEDGRQNILFGDTIRSHCPVHILQGMEDPDVPWKQALKLVEHMAGDPVALTLIRDGDHRLSREQDILRLLQAIANIA